MSFCLSNGKLLKSKDCLKKPTPFSVLRVLTKLSSIMISKTGFAKSSLFFKPSLTSASYLNSSNSTVCNGQSS